MLNPFEMWVYDKTFSFRDVITDPARVDVTPVLNGAGALTIELGPNDPVADVLRTPGARVVCHFRGEHLLSGPVRRPETDFIPTGNSTFYVQDDYRILENTLAWVRPDAPITPSSLDDPGQAWQNGAGSTGTVKGQTGYYRWPAGVNSAESAIKHLVQLNCVERQGRALEVKPSQGRGGDARAAGKLPDIRFQSVAEAIAGILEWSGLVARVWQQVGNEGLVMDVFEPDEWDQVIEYDSGVIDSGTIQQMYPDATTIVVGGPGEDAARAFFVVNDPRGLADEYGDIIEVFHDATGANLAWSDDLAEDRKVPKYYLLRSDTDVLPEDKVEFQRYVRDAGNDALEDGLPTASLNVEIAEVLDLFQFMGSPERLHLGDWVNAKSRNVPVRERIREADISFSASAGLVVKPVLGDRTDDPDRELWKAVSGVDKATRNIIRKR